MNKIQVTRTGSISEGEFIAAPDFDYDEEPEMLADYRAKDQQWSEVHARGGYADIGWLEIDSLYEDGETQRVSTDWDQWIWRLVDENGTPVRAS